MSGQPEASSIQLAQTRARHRLRPFFDAGDSMGQAGIGRVVGQLASARLELVHLRKNPDAATRLFCLPGAGGSAATFHGWSARLPPEIEVIGVQLPGRGHLVAASPYRAMQPLVRDLADAMAELVDKPFVLFGHSMGALVGFELARRLRRDYGVSPVALLAAACPAPQLPRRQRPLHALPSIQLWAEIRRFGGTPQAVLESEELMTMVEPALRADLAICETYRYTDDRPLDCPLIAIGGSSDDDVSDAELEAWRAQTTSSFRVEMLRGGHFFSGGELSRLLDLIEREAIR
jgi:medium-chain acyl-[acyl-carrier-protein] hydrolase